MDSVLRNSHSLARGWLPAAACAAALVAMLLGFHSSAQPATGRWTPSADWSGGDVRNYAVHLVLLAGDGSPHHSRVLWWNGQKDGAMWGGQWGWTPGNEGCATFPSASFVDLGLPMPGMDIFCAGHIQMPDLGRLLVIGGTDTVTATYGDNRVRIFTPGSGSAAGTWSEAESMQYQRWYAGSVALRDGRLVAMNADMHWRHSIFGGRTRDGQVPASPQGDSLHRFAPVNGGAWESAVIPDEVSQGAGRPEPREGHSALLAGKFPFSGQVYFGGRNRDGDALDNTWVLRRENNTLGADHRYFWAKLNPTIPPGLRRSDHCAVLALDNMAPNHMMVVYGGLDENNAAIGGEPWRLHFVPIEGFKWQQMDTTGTGPGARFGHAAVYDITTLTVGSAARPPRSPTASSTWWSPGGSGTQSTPRSRSGCAGTMPGRRSRARARCSTPSG